MSTEAAWLLTPAAIRARCRQVYAAAERNELAHFALDLTRLDAAAAYVIATITDNYPDLAIPYHSRWRHFTAGGVDRWARLAAELEGCDPAEIGRIRTELAIVSVLLDAGAGPAWSYREAATGANYSRSEGLAVASLHLYRQGLFSAAPATPWRVDAAALMQLTEAQLAAGFQVGPDNPLVGLSGRLGLLQRLGATLNTQPTYFGQPARLGQLFDVLSAQAQHGQLPAAVILKTVLASLGPIWPGRLELDGVSLGDTWPHPAAGLVPFHKLSQWLSYSLVEPLEEAGITITDLDALTGLPEYRNGGLFLDLGVLQPKDPAVLTQTHVVGSELVVEWRALTVILLDVLAERVRATLGLDAVRLPLAKILEGGTWSAGRRIARAQRTDGAPPLMLDSDGTVF